MQTNDERYERKQKIYHSAIRFLSYREHGVKELRLKLLNKFDDGNDIDQVLRQLLKENVLSDQRYAESYIRSRANRGCGPERIRNELRQKGIESTLVEKTLEASEIAWSEELYKVWCKKFGGSKTEELHEKASQWRFLQYRGFPSSQIRALLG